MRRRPRTALKKQAKQERSQATVDAILTAASHILVQVGYDKTSTTRIAARAGVSIGSLYQYFPGKEAIVAELIDRHVRDTFALVRAEIGRLIAAPLRAAVRGAIELLFRAYGVAPALHRVFVEQVPRVGRLGRIQETERDLILLARGYLEAHREELRVTELDVAARVVVRAIVAVAYAAVMSEDQVAPGLLQDQLVDLALRYLAK